MISTAALNAIAGLVLMLAVVAGYVMLARRFRVLWHPLSIVAAVTIVGVTVSIAGVVAFGAGWPAVPAMLRRSAIGSIGWGVVFAGVAWVGRRVLAWWTAQAIS